VSQHLVVFVELLRNLMTSSFKMKRVCISLDDW